MGSAVVVQVLTDTYVLCHVGTEELLTIGWLSCLPL